MQYSSAKIWSVFRNGVQLLLFLMLILMFAFEAYILILVYTEGDAALPAMFGNFERVRALLETDDQREEFSFAVAGDTKGTGTFERLVGLLKDEPISFMVLLGDCVRNGSPRFHQYLRAELEKELRLPCPTFYVVGNHDVSKEEFPISRFEEVYGPTNFSFDYHGCLFIVLRILDKPRYSTKESLIFLESVLSDRRRDYRKVFIFMHIPPPISTDFGVRSIENPDKLLALFDKFKVDYVIAGDYHGYSRVKYRDTVYLVTGGGGARLRKNKYSAFHHAVVIKVGQQEVSERILFTKRNEELEDMMECCAMTVVYPWMKENLWKTLILNFGVVCCGIMVIRRFLKLHRSL